MEKCSGLDSLCALWHRTLKLGHWHKELESGKLLQPFCKGVTSRWSAAASKSHVTCGRMWAGTESTPAAQHLIHPQPVQFHSAGGWEAPVLHGESAPIGFKMLFVDIDLSCYTAISKNVMKIRKAFISIDVARKIRTRFDAAVEGGDLWVWRSGLEPRAAWRGSLPASWAAGQAPRENLQASCLPWKTRDSRKWLNSDTGVKQRSVFFPSTRHCQRYRYQKNAYAKFT